MAEKIKAAAAMEIHTGENTHSHDQLTAFVSSKMMKVIVRIVTMPNGHFLFLFMMFPLHGYADFIVSWGG